MKTGIEPFAALLQAYATHFDARDAAAFAELFTTDAIVVTPYGRDLVGRERILAMVERTPAGGHHDLDDPELVAHDGDRATTRTRFAATRADGQHVTGTYENVFSLTPEGWRIDRHVIVADP